MRINFCSIWANLSANTVASEVLPGKEKIIGFSIDFVTSDFNNKM
jgi:hypothetical protein